VVPHPFYKGLLSVHVLQYHLLQSRFLQLNLTVTPLRLANSSGRYPPVRDFHPLEFIYTCCIASKNKFVFLNSFSRAYNKCALQLMQGTHSTYPKVAVQWLNQALYFYLSLCLVDSEVLRNCHLRVAANRWRSS
jgi:hypothetical protein